MIISPNIRDDSLTGIDRSRKADVKTRDQCVIVITDGFEYRQARRTVGTQTVEYRYREADVVGQFRISMQWISVAVQPVKQSLVVSCFDGTGCIRSTVRYHMRLR